MTVAAEATPLSCRVHSVSQLSFDSVRGKTRMRVSDLGAPLRVMRGFQLEDGRLLVQIISAAPGLFAGDQYELSIDVASGARVVVLTPAATKIHSMPSGGSAQQSISASVATDASLEIYPTLSIPFKDSEFAQHVEIHLVGNARFGWLDPWAFGRISSGECYAFRRLDARIAVNRDRRPLYRDALRLAPAEGAISTLGVLENATHALSGCWFGPSEPWPGQGALDSPLAIGTVGSDGLYARGVFHDGAAFRHGLSDVHQRLTAAWGVSPISLAQFTL